MLVDSDTPCRRCGRQEGEHGSAEFAYETSCLGYLASPPSREPGQAEVPDALAVVYEMFQHPASCQVAGPTQTMHGQTMPVCTCGLTDALITLEADRTQREGRIEKLEAFLRYDIPTMSPVNIRTASRALLEVPDAE